MIFPGMVFNISVRFFIITGTTLAFFSFQDLFTSFLRSWYLVIFLISASLVQNHGINTSISNAFFSLFFLYQSMISGHNALFSLFTLDGIIRSYVSGTSMFSLITFGSFSHKFSGTGISKFLQMCQQITLQKLCCVVVCTAVMTRFFFFVFCH